MIRGGGATSLWGNMAMGGIVNIITREPTRTGASPDVNYGSCDSANAEVAGSVLVNDRLKLGMTYGHAKAGVNLTPAQYRNINLVPTASKADNVASGVYLTPSDELKLFAKAYYHQAYEDGLVWTLRQQLVELARAAGRQLRVRREVIAQFQRVGRRRNLRHGECRKRLLHAEQHQRAEPVRQPDRDRAQQQPGRIGLLQRTPVP